MLLLAYFNVSKDEIKQKGVEEEMLDRLKLIIKNNDLKQENKALYKENKQNREDINTLELQQYHSIQLANRTLDYLNDLEEIDRSGISEESKRKHRNVIINELRDKSIGIINELDRRQTF